jgi:hypothetical protein
MLLAVGIDSMLDHRHSLAVADDHLHTDQNAPHENRDDGDQKGKPARLKQMGESLVKTGVLNLREHGGVSLRNWNAKIFTQILRRVIRSIEPPLAAISYEFAEIAETFLKSAHKNRAKHGNVPERESPPTAAMSGDRTWRSTLNK